MIKIQELDPSRSDDYKQLRIEALRNHPIAFSTSIEDEIRKDKYRLYLERSKKGDLSKSIFALDNNKLIGCGAIYRDNNPKTKHIAHVGAIYVKSEYRKQGIAKKIFKKLETWALRKLEIIKIQLKVYKENTPALNLYKRLGYEIVGKLRKAIMIDDNYYDEYILEKLIK